MNTIANDEGRNINLKEKLLLKYAISNLSIVENYEHWDEMPYNETHKKTLHKLIRLGKDEFLGPPKQKPLECVICNHLWLELNNDDYEHVFDFTKKRSQL